MLAQEHQTHIDEPVASAEDGIRTALERLARPPEAGPEEARAEIKP